MNDTMEKSGFGSFPFVFGIIPGLSKLSTDLPSQKERMAALKSAQAKTDSTVTDKRVLEALAQIFPQAADQ